MKQNKPLKAKKPLQKTTLKLKRPKPKVGQLKKKADKLWSLYVRLRDSENGQAVCITCGVSKPVKEMQCGHFVKRSVNLLRFDEENTNAQCYACNIMKYGEQYLYAKALDLKYGDGTADKLMAQRTEAHKFTVEELEQIIHDAKVQIEWMMNQAL